MALILTSDYSKKLGLPGFSSHQFSVSIRTELTDLDRVPGEVARLYQLLQQAVDREIQQTGFVPGDGYGEGRPLLPARDPVGDGGVRQDGDDAAPDAGWQCSERQRGLIADLAAELELDRVALDRRSQRLFRRPAHQLNKLCASGLISDLLAEAGTRRHREGRRGSDGGGEVRSADHARLHGNGNGRPRAHSLPDHRNGGAS